jgi:hypothetical protein
VNYNEAIKMTKEYVLNDSFLKYTFIENWKVIFAENVPYLNNDNLINKVFTELTNTCLNARVQVKINLFVCFLLEGKNTFIISLLFALFILRFS